MSITTTMEDFKGAESFNAFKVGDVYLVKHYFDGQEVFDKLRKYYNNYEYRFEIPEKNFNEIKEFLEEHDYKPIEIQNPEPYIVINKKYTKHPSNIFKDSVLHKSKNDYNFFLMKDKKAVERAIKQGSTKLTDTNITINIES